MALTFFSDPFYTDIDRAVSRALSPYVGMPTTTTGGAGAITTPGSVWHPMDVIEMPNNYRIVADAPGMNADDIKVEISGGNLLVSGEKSQQRRTDDVVEGARVHRNERTFTRFSRSFALPEDAKEEGVNARLENGVLTVDVPKEAKPVAEPKRIKVASAERTVPVEPKA